MKKLYTVIATALTLWMTNLAMFASTGTGSAIAEAFFDHDEAEAGNPLNWLLIGLMVAGAIVMAIVAKVKEGKK